MSICTIPPRVEGVSQNWLESVLSNGLRLPSFKLHPLEANNSSIARLLFEEDPPVGHVPRSCILKLCPAGHDFLAASEINYYNRDYLELNDAPIPKCYQAAWAGGVTSESKGQSYALFLEDLSVGYTDNKMIDPTDAHAANLGHALGQLHAHHWGHDADPEGRHDLKSDFGGYLAHVSKGLEPVLHEMGDALDTSSRARLHSLFDTDAERILERAIAGNSLTLVHGDPNPTNVLTCTTHQKGRPPLFLIDRQPFDWSMRVWLGASDLVYAAVPFWSEEHRRALQTTLLQSYHRSLVANGVENYSLVDLQEDWRVCACMAAFTAIEWGSDPKSLTGMKWLWEKQLRRALMLLEDCDVGN